MTLAELNAFPRYRAEEELMKCCGSTAWVRTMAGRRPFTDRERMFRAASEVWWGLDASDWLEAFRAHPQIGRPDASQKWATREQAGMDRAGTGVAEAMADANRAYLEKFGYIYIVCASGKSAEEMLTILKSRMSNTPENEIRIAAGEQDKITRLRIEKLVPF